MIRLRVAICFLISIIIFGCQGTQQTAQKGSLKENIRRVTPKDVKSYTNKIIVNEYQFQINRSEETQSSLYFETDWKYLDLTSSEEEKGISDVRMRVKIRTQKIRRGMDEFTVHNLNYVAELQGITEGSNGDWTNIEITPERENFMAEIFDDYETEFGAGVMQY
jgi:hypothetical protein